MSAAITTTSVTLQTAAGITSTVLCSTVSTEDLPSSENQIHIYPNPSSGKFTLDMPRAGLCHLYDPTGREVFSFSLPSGSQEVSLDLESGVYFLRVEGFQLLQRVVIGD